MPDGPRWNPRISKEPPRNHSIASRFVVFEAKTGKTVPETPKRTEGTQHGQDRPKILLEYMSGHT